MGTGDGGASRPATRRRSAASERNRQPILVALLRFLPARGTALEVASGTGQHVSHFAQALGAWSWQPSDASAEDFPSIRAWCDHAGASNVRAPVLLDVLSPCWPSQGAAFGQDFDLIFCANMLHIAPWSTCAGLMQGAARHLRPAGLLVTYGPYLEGDVPTSPGNLEFDQSLRARDPAWGIRAREDVVRQAELAGLQLRERVPMPANNLMLVFCRKAAAGAFGA